MLQSGWKIINLGSSGAKLDALKLYWKSSRTNLDSSNCVEKLRGAKSAAGKLRWNSSVSNLDASNRVEKVVVQSSRGSISLSLSLSQLPCPRHHAISHVTFSYYCRCPSSHPPLTPNSPNILWLQGEHDANAQANSRGSLCDHSCGTDCCAVNLYMWYMTHYRFYRLVDIHSQRKFRNLTSDYTESCCWRSVNQQMWSRRCDIAEMCDMRIWRVGSARNAVFYHSFVA